MIRAGLVALAALLSAPVPGPPTLDLPALFPAAMPPGFAPIPDQPNRIGPLDAAAAAGVLDRSGQLLPQVLVDAGFRVGHAKAWTKQDSQEVVLDVLLEFGTDRQAERFADRVLESRRQVKGFEVPGLPDATGFERGPAAPTLAEPGQREVVMSRGRVVAIVVVAGHAEFPSVELAAAVGKAQHDALQAVPPAVPPDEDKSSRTPLLVLAQALLVVVAWQMVMALVRHPLPFTPMADAPATPAAGAASDAPPSGGPTTRPQARRRSPTP